MPLSYGTRLGPYEIVAKLADDRLLMMRVAPQAPGDAARMVLLQNWRAAVGR
jgi:hypothetical protein